MSVMLLHLRYVKLEEINPSNNPESLAQETFKILEPEGT